MADSRTALEQRWAPIRKRCIAFGWNGDDSPRITDLAREHGFEWYVKRGRDMVGDFIGAQPSDLFMMHYGFGRTKAALLIEILSAATGEAVADQGAAPAESLNTADVLTLWGVPDNYPLSLVPLSTRLLNFCENQHITTLHTLLQFWSVVGEEGFRQHRNIGQRTVNEMVALFEAVACGQAEAARQWLPLNDREDGLCVRRAIGLAASRLDEHERQIVTRRLVDGLILEDVGEEFGITRERVRQLADYLLDDLRAVLTWFADDHEAMIEFWMDGGEWQSAVTPQSTPELTSLVVAGIEAIFDETPRGVAKRLAGETELERWLGTLCRHPDLHLGGVELQPFLDEHVPTDKQPLFIALVGDTAGIVLDHSTGLVRPRAPCIRDTVQALLEQEIEPIPLTWLVHRVQGVLGREAADGEFIRRNRYRWSMSNVLDLAMVIWDQ